jgi:hypothetical protein
LSPPRSKNLTKNLLSARPKSSTKKLLGPITSTERGGNRKGFFRKSSSFEAAKYNTSLAASLKRKQFEIIMIDSREFPAPSEPPVDGDTPAPPPSSPLALGAALLSPPPFSPPPPPPSVTVTGDGQEEKGTWGGRGAELAAAARREVESSEDTSSFCSSITADSSYKDKQFAMQPGMLSAALKKRSQWTLNRHDSSEFYT